MDFSKFFQYLTDLNLCRFIYDNSKKDWLFIAFEFAQVTSFKDAATIKEFFKNAFDPNYFYGEEEFVETVRFDSSNNSFILSFHTKVDEDKV